MTGSKPFQGLSDLETREAFIRGRYPSLASLPALQGVIVKCHDQGYSSIEELLKAVEAESIVKFYNIDIHATNIL
jgi:hypothetical protein